MTNNSVSTDSGPTSLRFGLGTFSGLDSVHVEHLLCCLCLFHINCTSHQPKNEVIHITASMNILRCQTVSACTRHILR